MITIELFDGTRLEFPDDTPADVIDRIARGETNQRNSLVDEVAGGKVTRMPDGSLAFSSPGYATNDQDTIKRLMEGVKPATVVREGFQDQAISDNPVASRAAAAIQGVPFLGQYADEAIGATFGQQARDATRYSQSAMADRHPGQTMAMQLGTGLAATIPAATAMAPAIASSAPVSMAGRVVSGLLGGGAIGGIEGAVSGYGSGTDAETRSRNAMNWGLLGAGTGAAIGGALPAIAGGVKRAADFAADKFSRTARIIPGLSKEASDQLMLAGRADDIGIAGVSNIRAAGQQGMVADAGPAMATLTDRAVNMSGAGAKIAGEAVEGRAASAASALGGSFDNVMGGAEGINTLSRNIKDAARPGINAAYAEAYASPIDYASAAGRKIEDILGRMPRGIAQAAIDKANARMAWDGARNMQIMASIADDGTVTFTRPPNVMQLDYIKRAFDRIAEDGFDVMTQRYSSDASLAQQVARGIRNAVKDAVPAYGKALSNAADEFSLQRANRIGETLLGKTTTREAVADWLANAGKLEKAAAVRGLRSQIDELMANARRVPGTPEGVVQARSIFKDMSSEAARTKIAMLLGDDQASAIFRSLDEAEQALVLRANIARGSDTAPRLKGEALQAEAEKYSPGGIFRDTASGNLLSAPKRALEIAAGNTPAEQMARREETYRQIAEYLVQQGPRAEAAAQQMQGLLNYIGTVSPATQAIGRTAAATFAPLGYLSAVQRQR